jgi:hypothetical protein
VLDREIAEPGYCGKVCAHRDFHPATVSITERIAATFGPAWALPTWIQFFLPTAMGRTRTESDAVSFLVEGVDGGSISMLAVRLG